MKLAEAATEYGSNGYLEIVRLKFIL